MRSSETLEISLQGPPKSPKTKKETPSKKKNTSRLAESMPTSRKIENGAAFNLNGIFSAQASNDEAQDESKDATTGKTEKCINKRKSSALEEPIEDASGPNTSFKTPPADLILFSDDKASQQKPSNKRKASVEEIEVDITAPKPPSKKTLRRLKKGKPVPQKSGAEATPEPEPEKEKIAETEKRSEHGVWIGNLPWSVSKDELRKFLVEHSDITPEIITRVHLPGPNDSKTVNKVEKKPFGRVEQNKGFAYVDFSAAEAVEKAVELSEQLMSGRRLLIKHQKSFEGRPQKTKEQSRSDCKPPSKKVFIGNLSFDTTEHSLKDHFEKCGAIESVKIAAFEDSGKCKGYAWIVFEELEAAKSAVRGFVHIQEGESDESDGDEASDGGFDDNKVKKTKLRKWWVNKIKGRPLRTEFAEGADVRYKKRYGKEGTKTANSRSSAAAGEDLKENEKPASPVKAPEYRPGKVAYDRPYGAPRLTGGIVKSEGKKVTFLNQF